MLKKKNQRCIHLLFKAKTSKNQKQITTLKTSKRRHGFSRSGVLPTHPDWKLRKVIQFCVFYKADHIPWT